MDAIPRSNWPRSSAGKERWKRSFHKCEALARQSPVLMIFEDAHWTDPTSLEAFGRVVDRIATLRVLLIVTFRPEFEPPWIGRPHVTALTINRLAEREVGAMIDRVVGNKLLPASIRQDIIERTDGIPLFVEEMTKAVLEAESQGARGARVAAVPSPALAVPASLHASLMARLDRLGAAKEVAQIGAAIGREFSHALLAAVVRKPEAELGSALDRLIEAGLLFRQGVPPHATYLFKHALVQDAAYGTLLREPRRALHARIAEALESQFAEIAESQPELLARHCTEAGLIEKAARLVGQGGTAVAGALGAGRSRRAANARPRPDCDLARHTGAASRADQAPGRAYKPAHAYQRLCRPGDQGGCGAGTPADRTSGSARRASRRPTAVVFGPLRLLGRELCSVQRRRLRELAAQFLALAEKQRATVPLMIGHRIMGISLMLYGRHCGKPGTLRSGDRALRSRRASSAGDAIWPGRWGLSLVLSVVGCVAAWLSGGRASRR